MIVPIKDFLEQDMAEATLTAPILALRGIVLLPHMSMTIDIRRDTSKLAIEYAVENHMHIACFKQKDSEEEYPLASDLEAWGVLAKITQVMEVNDLGILRVTIEGVVKVRNLGAIEDSIFLARVHAFKGAVVPADQDVLITAKRRVLESKYKEYSVESNRQSIESVSAFLEEDNISVLTDKIAGHGLSLMAERQVYLKLESLEERIDYLIDVLNNEIMYNRMEKQIEAKVKLTIDKNQRDYFLREKIKVMHEELDDTVSNQSAANEYREKLSKLTLEDAHREKIEKEINKLELYPAQNPESGVIRNFLDTLFDLPWGKKASLDYSMIHISESLDQEHYALTEVKERILEFIAVQKLRQDKGETRTKGPILCLVGPPGVGKTSIASSIASAMGRQFVRMSLGGVRDEAEIRGHRKTYIGAMPGRIINAMLQAGDDNPLILMDEIDKMSSDYKGDPSSALLEVLDPEQNKEFRDHFLEIPYDLSEVLFITTANRADLIPPALRDRMEVIELNGYTIPEKFEIAKRHLLPKQIKENALEEDEITIYKPAMMNLISQYTAEAGVRQLERMLAKVCRKVALEIAKKRDSGESVDKVKVTAKNLIDYAGKPKYSYDLIAKKAQIGLVRGLAWTAAGGDTLEIEASFMPGKGGLRITGQLGDVMQESCQVALAYVKSKAEAANIASDFFDTHDIHVHVPAGAVPKDGPSAGITLATAIYSAMSSKAVAPNIAMTGEITLRGRVLKIGGLKEKLIAADRAGIKRVIIPAENTIDLDDIPSEILEKVEVQTIEHADELIKILF